MREIIYKLTQGLQSWHERTLTGIDFLYVVASIIGLFCGIGAGLMKLAIDGCTRFVFDHFHLESANWLFFLLPIVGIMLATAFTRYVIRQPMDHASERIDKDMAEGKCSLSPRLILGPIIGCTITLGLGGSAGAEDPIAYTGAALGSNVGKAFRLGQDRLSALVGCGAAAAIAGIFMAPIGGLMFALEVLKMKQSLKMVLAITLSSLVSALSCYIMLGCHTDITFVPAMRFDNRLIPWVLACGVFCGIYSLYYSSIMAWSRRMLARIGNVWLKALAGALVLATLLLLFPSLYGEGYDAVHKLMIDNPINIVSYGPLYKLGLNFDVLLLLLIAVLAVKPFATSATNDSGGVGGDFTPTFFCGGVAGFLFAAALNHFCGLHLPTALFAFFGMSAVMAGAIQAPLMAIFITAEMTGLYGFILPLTLAALASMITTVLAGKTPRLLDAFRKNQNNDQKNQNNEN